MEIIINKSTLNAKVLCTMLAVVLFSASGIAGIVQGVLYSQNFNAAGQASSTSLAGWTAIANNADYSNNLRNINGASGGYSICGYFVSGDGVDYNLGIYETSLSKKDYIKFVYTAEKTITDITGSYDFEAGWSRVDSSLRRTAGFQNGLRYKINDTDTTGGTASWGTQIDAPGIVNNSLVTAELVTHGLTDAQMDAAGLSIRNRVFSVSGVTLQAGDTLTLVWSMDGTLGDQRNLMAGIDNLVLQGFFEQTSLNFDYNLIIDQVVDGAYLIDLSGTGSVTKTGAGNLILTGTNSYTGGTTVSAGTLTGTTTNIQGGVVNNSAVVFDQTAGGTYSGNMSGTGSLTKTGAGNLILTGTNSYTGGTTVSAGTLTGTTTNIQGGVVNNSAVVFDQTAGGTYSGNMSGTGSLTKTGVGNLILTGTNSYTGGTTVSAGTLKLTGQLFGNVAVNGGTFMGTGTLANGGSLTLNNGSVFAPGASIGTTTITGNYIQNSGATLEVEVEKAAGGILRSDLVDVAGAATLQSGSVINVIDVTGSGGIIGTGDTFTIIQTVGGITDNGVIIADTSASLSFTGSIDDTDYILTALRNALADSVSGVNSKALLHAIDLDTGSASGDYVTVINELTALNASQLQSAAEGLSPMSLASAASFTATMNQRLDTNLARYLNLRRTNNIDSPLMDLAWMDKSLLLADAAGSPEILGQVISETETAQSSQQQAHRNSFVEPFSLFYRQDSTPQSTGFSASSVGSYLGTDVSISDNSIMGVGGTYSHSYLSFDHHVGHADIDSFRIGPYGSYFDDPWFIDSSVSFGYHLNETERKVQLGNLKRTAEARYDAYDASAYLGAGYQIQRGGWTLTPTGSIQFVCYRNESFKESDGGSAGLDVDASTSRSLLGRIGLQAQTMAKMGRIRAIPELFFGYAHEFMDEESVDSRFLNGAAKFTTAIDSERDDSVYYGMGLSVLLTSDVSAFLRYEGQTYSASSSHSLDAGVSIQF